MIIIIKEKKATSVDLNVLSVNQWSLYSMFTTSRGNKFHCFTVYGIKKLL